MNQTNITLKNPNAVEKYNINIGNTSLPFDVKSELSKYSTIFIVKEFDPFSLVCLCEASNRDYIIYSENEEGDKKILFTSSSHSKCCKCCEQCVLGYLCCGYACCDSIEFQMDYNRNGETFYTQGYNLTKGCHCCDFFACCLCWNCLNCAGRKLYLRENIDPDDPKITTGRPKGKTETNCCFSSCTDRFVKYTTENKTKGYTVRAACCDICKNNCLVSLLTCCGCCNTCVAGFDFEMSIEDPNGIKTGNILIYSGCCSKKTEGKMCYIPRAYMEVNMPPNATSEEKFQIIADAIHLDLANAFI